MINYVKIYWRKKQCILGIHCHANYPHKVAPPILDIQDGRRLLANFTTLCTGCKYLFQFIFKKKIYKKSVKYGLTNA